MRILQLVRVDPIPNPAFEKPAGHQLLIPERIRQEPVFRQPMRERHRAIEIDHRSARSRCRLRKNSSIVITGWPGGGPRPTEIGGVIHPCRKASNNRASDSTELRVGRWADFCNHTVAIGDQNRFAAGGKPNILTQLILERFEANGAHERM